MNRISNFRFVLYILILLSLVCNAKSQSNADFLLRSKSISGESAILPLMSLAQSTIKNDSTDNFVLAIMPSRFEINELKLLFVAYQKRIFDNIVVSPSISGISNEKISDLQFAINLAFLITQNTQLAINLKDNFQQIKDNASQNHFNMAISFKSEISENFYFAALIDNIFAQKINDSLSIQQYNAALSFAYRLNKELILEAGYLLNKFQNGNPFFIMKYTFSNEILLSAEFASPYSLKLYPAYKYSDFILTFGIEYHHQLAWSYLCGVGFAF